MEIKHIAFEELEVKEDGDSRTVEGFASVFNNVDSYNDIVLPGAFAKTLKKGKPVPMLWQHDSGQVIGKWDTLEERDKGLYVKGSIIDTTMGSDAYKLAKAGAVTGMSIGYGAEKYEIDQDKGTRKLIEVKLWEVSLVTFPANEKAQVTRVKSQDGALMTERAFEEFLRDVGELSQKEAKLVVAEGYRALLKRRDGGEQGLEEIAALMRQFAQQLTA
jgi:HK97 family phage prohead protease